MTEVNQSHTNPVVLEKASRRRFTASYKLRLLDEAERCAGQGQVGELLRREGLYSSHMTSWRRQRDAGALDALEPKRRGRKPKASDPAAKELERLRRQNLRLSERLRQVQTIIEFQNKSFRGPEDSPAIPKQRRIGLIDAVETLGQDVGVRQACQALGVPRGSFYRHRSGPSIQNRPTRTPSARALSGQERQRVKDLLYSERFAGQTPRQVFAVLIDEGKYLCSVRTMYRILNEDQTNRERRNRLRCPNYQKPDLLATAPNRVWSWGITKLLGPEKGTYYYLYVIRDIFSRYVVGWTLARSDSADLASTLIRETMTKQKVDAEQLIIHSDRGELMTSHSLAQLLATLGVTKVHSCPHVSNENPFSNSQFKTLMYGPSFPSRFDGYEHALGFCRTFMPWYNDEHYHSGIGLVTPAMLHYGQAPEVLAARQSVLETAYRANPERFVRGLPRTAKLPTAGWINPPKIEPLRNDEKEWLPEPNRPWKPAVSLPDPRPGYPSPTCIPAELDSVSPGVQKSNLPPASQQPLNTRAMPSKISGVWGQAPDESNLARSEISIY